VIDYVVDYNTSLSQNPDRNPDSRYYLNARLTKSALLPLEQEMILQDKIRPLSM
jgi:hypothetical protein